MGATELIFRIVLMTVGLAIVILGFLLKKSDVDLEATPLALIAVGALTLLASVADLKVFQ